MTSTAPQFSGEQLQSLIVLDASILLEHLDFVKQIRHSGLTGLGFPTLLVSQVVLRNLDSLKNRDEEFRICVQSAARYIYTSLKNKVPRLWGQSKEQAAEAKSRETDDQMLHCCLKYRDLYPAATVFLCSTDENLCRRAVLSDVQALSEADLLELKPLHFNPHFNRT